MNLGIFDSGLGGLTVLKEVLKNNSFDRIIFFGDTLNVPYGEKDRGTLYKLAKNNIEFLRKMGADEIVAACGTVSSNVLEDIQKEYDFKLLGIVDSACKEALRVSDNKRIGVIATSATVKSNAFKKGLKEADVYQVACPKFAVLIEQGKTDSKEMEEAVKEYLSSLKEKDIDTLILGCTHYPLIKDKIDEFFEHKVKLVNSGTIISQELFKGEIKKPILEFYVSGDEKVFKKNAKYFLEIKEIEKTERV